MWIQRAMQTMHQTHTLLHLRRIAAHPQTKYTQSHSLLLLSCLRHRLLHSHYHHLYYHYLLHPLLNPHAPHTLHPFPTAKTAHPIPHAILLSGSTSSATLISLLSSVAKRAPSPSPTRKSPITALLTRSKACLILMVQETTSRLASSTGSSVGSLSPSHSK